MIKEETKTFQIININKYIFNYILRIVYTVLFTFLFASVVTNRYGQKSFFIIFDAPDKAYWVGGSLLFLVLIALINSFKISYEKGEAIFSKEFVKIKEKNRIKSVFIKDVQRFVLIPYSDYGIEQCWELCIKSKDKDLVLHLKIENKKDVAFLFHNIKNKGGK